MIIISHFHNGHASWPNPCLISLWSFTNSNEMTQTSAFVSVLARCDYVLKFNHNKLGRDLQNKSSVTDLYSVTHLFRMPPLSDVNTGAVMWVFNAVIDSTSSRIEALHNLLYANMSAYTPTESHSTVCLFQHIFEAVLCFFFFFLNTVVQSQCFYGSSSMWNVTDVLGIISHLAALMALCFFVWFGYKRLSTLRNSSQSSLYQPRGRVHNSSTHIQIALTQHVIRATGSTLVPQHWQHASPKNATLSPVAQQPKKETLQRGSRKGDEFKWINLNGTTAIPIMLYKTIPTYILLC